MKPSRVLIKLGGAALKEPTGELSATPAVLDIVTQAVKQYRQYGYEVVLVHGGGPAINAELTARGIGWTFLDGQRVTTPEMMDVIESTLSGKINGQLVRHLSSHGIPSIGFSGTDANTLLCTPASKDLGRVGKIEHVNVKWLESVMAMPNSPVPVISPIGVGVGGESYNINADWAASHLAVALQAKYLIFLTDQSGILNDGRQLVRTLSPWDLSRMIETGVVKDGMSTKARAMLHALEGGVSSVRVMNGNDAVKGLWSNLVGTWCAADEEQPTYEPMVEEVNYVHA